MSDKPKERIEVSEGTAITVDVLRWNEGWDFDCPVAVLRPVVRFSPNGEQPDQMVENVGIDGAVYGFLASRDYDTGIVDRQYPLKTLKRRWSEARRGKEFPQKQYSASRFKVTFIKDGDGQLSFETEEVAFDV